VSGTQVARQPTQPPQGLFSKVKRKVVGAPLATEQLAHERLGKATALAVFASDNLSSSAYATEEILRVLIYGGVGVVAFSLVIPITAALLVVLGILLFSYRQTIKAYPQAGGAYLVTRDNFGIMPAQIAGISLLTDYILTVSVSVSAGTLALTSVYPSLAPWRVEISLAFIAIIAFGNLRGVRESGKLFAAPTFFFIGMMALLLGLGLARLATGSLPTHVHTFARPDKAMTVPLFFLVLRAYASGGAAVTGVEAISNGVPAFKRPEWRNARTTLMWMGSILAVLFLGLSLLAAHMHVVPDPEEKVSVVAQIGRAVFGSSGFGHALATLLQVATMLILVLAANTSFADFPRLASFQAGDRFLPNQLTRHGDRLVYSNGIIVLAALAAVLVAIFHASVTRLIPLYAIGVFTSFTFSQAGMARRHIRIKEPGWRTGLFINGLGAIVTGVVTVIVAAVKFTQGAYIVLTAIPVIFVLLYGVNRHYRRVGRELRHPDRRLAQATENHVVLLVGRPSVEERRAYAYAELIGSTDARCVHFRGSDERPGTTEAAWARELGIALTAPALEERPSRGTLASDVRGYIKDMRRRIPAADFVTVTIAERVRSGLVGRLGTPRGFLLKTTLLFTPGVVVTDVPHIPHAGHDPLVPGRPPRHVVVVLVSGVHNATLRAIDYARILRADELRIVHISLEPTATERVVNDWQEWEPGHPLEVVESPYRSLTRPVQSYVRDLTSDGNTVATIVLPEFVVDSWWRQFLHNQSALALKRLFVSEPGVVVTSVPYHLSDREAVLTPR
jgi:amino acid transporter